MFSGLGTSQGPGSNPKKYFLIKCYIITVLNICGAFRPKKWRSNKWIINYSFKKWFWWGGQFFRQKFFLKKPNTLEYAQVLVVMCPKPNSVTALLSPTPQHKAGLQRPKKKKKKSEPRNHQNGKTQKHLEVYQY